MKIDSRTVLHVAAHDNRFAAFTFVRGESTSHDRTLFLIVCVASSVGYHAKVLLDQCAQYQSNEIAFLHLAAGIDRKDADVESHNSLGKFERYNFYLKHIYGIKLALNTPLCLPK